MNTKGKMKRLLAVMVCLMMVFMSIPTSVFAGTTVDLGAPSITHNKNVPGQGNQAGGKHCAACAALEGMPNQVTENKFPQTGNDMSFDFGGNTGVATITKQTITFTFDIQDNFNFTANYMVVHVGGMHYFYEIPGGVIVPGVTYTITLPKANFSWCAFVTLDNPTPPPPQPAYGTAEVVKTVSYTEGSVSASINNTFHFGLYEGDTLIEDVNITMTAAGSSNPKSFATALTPGAYTIKEIVPDPAAAGWTYDDTVYNVDVDDEGTVTYNGNSTLTSATFENGYYQAPVGTVVEVAKKVQARGVKNPDLTNVTFTFQLYKKAEMEGGNATLIATLAMKNLQMGKNNAVAFDLNGQTLTPGAYYITEVTQENWDCETADIDVTIHEDGRTTYGGDQPNKVPVFVNNYTGEPEPETNALKGKKIVTLGKNAKEIDLTDVVFEFGLYTKQKAGDLVATATVGGLSWDNAEEFTFTPVTGDSVAPGHYFMREIAGSDTNWKYDNNVFSVKIKENGKIVYKDRVKTEEIDTETGKNIHAWMPVEGFPTFKNKYVGTGNEEPPQDDVLKVNKSIDYDISGDHTPADATFTFNLIDESGEGAVVVATSTAVASGSTDGSVPTTEFVWDAEGLRAGIFKLVEKNGGLTGWDYDDNVYYVEITVRDGIVTVKYNNSTEQEINGVTFNNKYTYSSGGSTVVHERQSTGGTTINDDQVPLVEVPDLEVPLAILPEPEVPLADIPQTGVDGNVAFNMLMLGLSLGAFLAAFAGRRRKADAEQE